MCVCVCVYKKIILSARNCPDPGRDALSAAPYTPTKARVALKRFIYGLMLGPKYRVFI